MPECFGIELTFDEHSWCQEECEHMGACFRETRNMGRGWPTAQIETDEPRRRRAIFHRAPKEDGATSPQTPVTRLRRRLPTPPKEDLQQRRSSGSGRTLQDRARYREELKGQSPTSLETPSVRTSGRRSPLYSREKFSEGLAKRAIGRSISCAEGEITAVKAKLHRMALSSNVYGYTEICKALGPLKMDETFGPNDPKKNRGVKNYHNCFFKQLQNGRLTIFLNPSKPGPRVCYMRSNDTNKELIAELHEALPLLEVSSLEYTMDIHCKTPGATVNLMQFMKRFLYIPYGRGVKTFDDLQQAIEDEDNDEAEPIHVDNEGIFFGRNTKIYIRGSDEEKVGGGWSEGNWKRVRTEFRATRDHLRKVGIKSIGDLLASPRFTLTLQVHGKFRYQFKQAKESSRDLPQRWDPMLDCLMDDIVKKRREGTNLASQIEDAPDLEWLPRLMRFQAALFDLYRWPKGGRGR